VLIALAHTSAGTASLYRLLLALPLLAPLVWAERAEADQPVNFGPHVAVGDEVDM
jgi:hypothetical protein